MPGSTLSVFSEPDDFQQALREEGCVDLIVTGNGKFRSNLSLIELHRMRLAEGDERQSRVAFIAVPPRFARVTLPMGSANSLVCSGIAVQPGEIVTHSSGHRFHERTNGPCRWGTMSILTSDFATFGRAMSGGPFSLPEGEARWRPAPEVLRTLIDLHQDAFAATANCPRLPVDDQAARGLEQQLLGTLMECLVEEPLHDTNPARRRSAEIMNQLEDVIRNSPVSVPHLAEIRTLLGVSETTLQRCCQEHLNMGPNRYLYLHRMRLAHRRLREGDHTETSVAEIARLHGFDGRGGFPKAYRALFGELPSVTLRRRTTQ